MMKHFTDNFCNCIMIIVIFCYKICYIFYLREGICHCYSHPGMLKHIYIIIIVSNCKNIFVSYVKTFSQNLYSPPFRNT